MSARSYHFIIEVGPNPETIEAFIVKVFAGMGLNTPDKIRAFDNYLRRNFNVARFYQDNFDKNRNDPEIIRALKNEHRTKKRILFYVPPAIVEELRSFGINLTISGAGKANFVGYKQIFEPNVRKNLKTEADFTPAKETPIAQWTTDDKLKEVIKRAAAKLPESIGSQLLALLDPLALAIVVGVVVIWAGSHFFGVGEIADVILLVVGYISIGPIAWQAGGQLINFATKTVGATKEEDLDEAAKNLAEAVSMLTVQVVMLLLLKKAPKVFNDARNSLKSSTTPLTIKTVGEPPITKGKLFYEPPEIKIERHSFAGKDVPGSTDRWGNSTVYPGRNASLKDIQLAKFHEEFHQLLAPKFQLFPRLRQIRTILKTNSYLQSYLLRYIEEALAETTAQIRLKGFAWQNIVEGIKFPIGEAIGEQGYVTTAKIGVEAKGILLGPINVGGMIFRVYLSFTKDW